MGQHFDGLDHVRIVTADLAQARDLWRDLGFIVTPHADKLLILFPGDHLEIILDPDAPTGPAALTVRGSAQATPTGPACARSAYDALRTPTTIDHPNGAVGLRSVLIAAEDPEAMGDAWAALLGIGATATTDDLMTVRIGRQSLIYATPDDAVTLRPDLIDPPTPGMIFAVNLLTRSLDRTTLALKAGGVAAETLPGDAVRVDAEEAGGVALDFVDQ